MKRLFPFNKTKIQFLNVSLNENDKNEIVELFRRNIKFFKSNEIIDSLLQLPLLNA